MVVAETRGGMALRSFLANESVTSESRLLAALSQIKILYTATSIAVRRRFAMSDVDTVRTYVSDLVGRIGQDG